MSSLKGKVVLVTGGSRGIGREIVVEFVKNEALVAFTYSSEASRPLAEELIKEAISIPGEGRAFGYLQDIKVISGAPKIMSAVLDEFSADHIDILVNNAGIGGLHYIEDLTEETFDFIFATNVKGVVFLTQAVLPYFPKQGGGRIINVSSIAARIPYAGASIYSASKGALESLTKTWAVEFGRKYGITVNAVSPGPVDTGVKGISDRTKPPKEAAAERHGHVNDIAPAVLFLAREEARWITGDTISANGGLLFT